MSTRTILVTGDLVIDHHIYEGSRHHFGDSAPGVHVTVQAGGAALVAGLLKNLPGLENNSFLQREMPAQGHDDDISHHAYAFWRPLPKDNAADKRFWRCAEAMGFGAHRKSTVGTSDPINGAADCDRPGVLPVKGLIKGIGLLVMMKPLS